MYIVAEPPKIFIGTGYVPNEMEEYLVKQYNRFLVNAYYLWKKSKYWNLIQKYRQYAKEIMLDNGAYQAWKHGKFLDPDILLHIARKLKPEYLIIPDAVLDVKRSRELAKLCQNWQNEFNCIVVLHGADISEKELLKDFQFYKELGYDKFAFPCVSGKRELIPLARKHCDFLHGLGCNFNLYFKYPYFDSIDVGSYRLLWVFRNQFQKAIIKEVDR